MRAFGCAKERKAFEHQTQTVNVKWLFVGHSECAVQRYSKKQRENQCHRGSSFVIFGIDHKTLMTNRIQTQVRKPSLALVHRIIVEPHGHYLLQQLVVRNAAMSGRIGEVLIFSDLRVWVCFQ